MLMLAGAIASRAPVKSAAYSAVVGVGKTSPPAGVLFLLGGIALAGLPPTNGFVSKLILFQSGVTAHEYWSLGVIATTSIISLVYIIRSFMKIWWEEMPEGQKAKPTGDQLIVPAMLITLCLLLGIWADPLVSLAESIVAWLGNPEFYIQAVLGTQP